MNSLHIPGFTAETSLYSSMGYRADTTNSGSNLGVTPAWPLPWGLCNKASSLCRDPARGGPWCDILDACFNFD